MRKDFIFSNTYLYVNTFTDDNRNVFEVYDLTLTYHGYGTKWIYPVEIREVIPAD